MITEQVSPQDMQSLTARYASLGAGARTGPSDPGPRLLAEGLRRPLMAPDGLASHDGAPIRAWPSMAAAVCEFAPGEVTLPRLYGGRTEHAFCFDGRFEIAFGQDQDVIVVLERFDLITLPAGVLRSIRHLGAGTGKLIIVTQIDPRAADSLGFAAARSELESRLGKSAIDALLARGVTFDAAGIRVSQADIDSRLSRAASRVPYQRSLESRDGVPAEVMKYMAASRVYPIVAPANLKGRNQNAPLKGLPGGSVSLAECDAGDGPQPHAHIDTREIFLCIEGRFDIVWGDRNEHKLTLEPLDMVAVPPTVMRIFRNITDGVGRLMVIIHGAEDMTDSISSFPEVAADVERRFGPEAVEAIKRVVKQSFDAIPGSRRAA